jgi:hypothetical protein
MKRSFIRRCRQRRKALLKKEGAFFKKEGQETFFGSAGQPLPEKDNSFFSSRMGYDFSNVKLHTGKEAAASAEGINARAYTVGNDIVFNEGQYNTESGEGKKLVAHELSHVIQHSKTKPAGAVISRKTTFNGTDIADINIAKKYTEAVKNGVTSSHVGITIPFVNGKNVTGSLSGHPLNVPGEKDITTTPNKGKYESIVSNIPDNAVTYEKHIPLKPSGNVWSDYTDANNFNRIIKKKCAGKQINIYVTGKPDSKTIISEVDTHEGAHVTQLETAYNAQIVGYDTYLQNAKATAATEKASKTLLLGIIRGNARGMYGNFVSDFNQAAGTFHGTAAGVNASFSAVKVDPSCMWIKSNVTI